MTRYPATLHPTSGDLMIADPLHTLMTLPADQPDDDRRSAGRPMATTPEIDHAALMLKARRVVATMRRRIDAAAKTQDGPWVAEWDSCDCGDGYGCSHGSWIHGIRFPHPVQEIPQGGILGVDHYRTASVDEVPTEAVEYLMLWQLAAGRAVLALLEGLLDAYNAAPVEHRGKVAGPLGWPAWARLIDALHDHRWCDGQGQGAYGEGGELDPAENAEFYDRVATDDPSAAKLAAEVRAAAAARLAEVKAGGAA